MSMEVEVVTGVSPSLHPAVISSIPGYEENKGHCAGAEGCFSAAYLSVADVHETRKSVRVDETRTPKAKALAVDEKAEQYLNKFRKQHGACYDNLTKTIEDIEKQVSAP